MNKEYFLDQSHLVLLKKEDGLIFQYSFLEDRWYGLPELQELLPHLDMFQKLTEQEVKEYINSIRNLIKNKGKTK